MASDPQARASSLQFWGAVLGIGSGALFLVACLVERAEDKRRADEEDEDEA